MEEVVDIMRVNVDKVLERDQKLSELDDRADALQAGASVFESSAAKLKRKYWWKNCKMMIMLGAICAIIVVVIFTPPSSVLHPGPGFSPLLPVLLHSFALFLKTRNAARGAVLRSLLGNSWPLLLAPVSCAWSLSKLWPREGGGRGWQRGSV